MKFPVLIRGARPQKRRVRAAQFKADGVSDDGTFAGYGSVFDTDPDWYGEIVAPGAFAESLAAHEAAGTRPALLWQHDMFEPIGVYTEVREDDRGLYVEGALNLDTQRGREAHSLLAQGALDGLSIGFIPKKHETDDETGIVTLTEVDLWEISVVTFPANEAARITEVRDAEITDLKSAERTLREAGLSQAAATGIVAGVKRCVLRGERDNADREQVVASARRAIAALLQS